ncbi:DUF4332 domain-containing protein [uncultured Thiohalocapsa sp.]|uniref:DUF4332 domain-containing protein n=1 Tax=uncultured Thiohalocapsa sp. TaxID=768990 RepID=UPI0025F173AA|nr:DUF4332 domain-containing protein [uncultured Thiohalocapsa sp.]
MPAVRLLSAPTLRIIAVGAATGAVASTGAVALYALLTGKALAAAALAKPAVGLPAGAGMTPGASLKGLVDLLLPGAVGAAGGGAAGAGVAHRQVRRDLGPLRSEVGDLARRVMGTAKAWDPEGSPPAGGAPSDQAQTSSTAAGTGPDPAAMRELERVRGIGPRYAALLVAGGVRSLGDLARADPTALREILGASAAAPMAAPARWIAQARELTKTGR